MDWSKLLGPKQTKNTVLNQLLSLPQRDSKKTAARFYLVDPHIINQADLLYLPHDHDFKYLLLVVDIGSRQCDAEPLKSKDAAAVRDAFIKIYKRKILDIPLKIEVDDGSEFKGPCLKFFKDHKVLVRVGKVNRHRMQGIVERYNQMIAYALFKRMSAQELLTGKTSREWIKVLPSLIEFINQRAEKRVRKLRQLYRPGELNDPIQQQPNFEYIYPLGSSVRVELDEPIDIVTRKRLPGRFRSTDIRFDPQVRTIVDIVIRPDSPVLYLLNDPENKAEYENVGYSRNQLQLVKNNESYHHGKDLQIPKENDQYIIDKIISKHIIKKNIYYKVSWVGYPDEKDFTLEPKAQLIKDVPQLIEQFEKQHKK
ncbi:putative chromobox protein 3 [Paratrimastix pyriformis]|uniref:Chromobox protein 3 n=1 Tax=Paratrimastix pyriformis TaxID=342808 RepID=A0ABQ8UCM5_9EUKA|nr:putative chromobox protein 3 [Paratrimastix pyriformis]